MSCGVQQRVTQGEGGPASTPAAARAELQADLALQKDANARLDRLLKQTNQVRRNVEHAGYNEKGDLVVVVNSSGNGKVAYVGRAGEPLREWKNVRIWGGNRCGGGFEIIPEEAQRLRTSDATPEDWKKVAEMSVGGDSIHQQGPVWLVLGHPGRNLPLNR